MSWSIGCRVIASLLPPSGVRGGPWVSSQDTVGCTPHICKGNRVEVCEVNSGGIWEGNHRDIAVRGGSVPGVYRASEVSRGELRPLRTHGGHPLRVMTSSREMAPIVA